ncbi:MAG: DUF4975 domain-containing protein [Muribaculaceae bacterium]|nr:DUF4975 domain-containing protein [Muribaculaceae bacterium]
MFLAFLTFLASVCGNGEVAHTDTVCEHTTTYCHKADATHLDTYYQPQGGYIGDPMPFYDPLAKNFKIMYLQEFRPNGPTFHPFWCLETQDGANYTMLGEMIPTGTVSEMDGALGTGSTIYNDTDSTYYTFYTGHSVNRGFTRLGEAVMLATSKDFKNWDKDSTFLLTGEGEYDMNDFRDPCLFKGDDGLYHMLVSTLKEGKGVIAEYTSPNLKEWTSVGVFMPMMWDRFYECPDVFKMGDWWYLVYSEKDASMRRVQYFKGRTLEELKKCTVNDAGIWPDNHEGVLDSRSFYAGKTASDGNERYIWGWCPTRPGKDNTNVGAYPAEPSWAGSLVAHRLIQHPDGSLTLGAVKGIEDKYSVPVDVKVMEIIGDTSEANGTYNIANDAYNIAGEGSLLFNRLGNCNKIECTVITEGDDDSFGISMARGSDSDRYYTLRVNPQGDGKCMVNFAQEGDGGVGVINGGEGYLFDSPEDNIYHITILTDNSVCTLYINDMAAYTARIYGLPNNCWSINSYGGNITINDLKVSGI